MPRQILDAKCPYCEGPLLVHRAAPGDGCFRVVCGDCGRGGDVSEKVIEPIRIRPTAPEPPETIAA